MTQKQSGAAASVSGFSASAARTCSYLPEHNASTSLARLAICSSTVYFRISQILQERKVQGNFRCLRLRLRHAAGRRRTSEKMRFVVKGAGPCWETFHLHTGEGVEGALACKLFARG